MTDPGYRKMVEQDFQKKKKVLEGNPGNLFAVFDSPMSVEEREALTFLYAYSPLIDLSFSGGDFLLKNVRWAFQAREAMPWGKDIPEDIFRHFVLPGWEREFGHGPNRFLQGTERTGCDL